jgi:hypothetical protein
MPYPLVPLSTEPAEWYKIGQKATDAAKHIEQVKDVDGDRHEWVSDTALTLGVGTSAPAPVNDLTSTDPLAYASANQLRVLEQALAKTGSLSPAGILTLTDRSGAALAPPINLSALAADKFLVSGSYVAATKTLDLVMSAGPVISIPVSALLAVTHDATLSGDGATTPLKVELSTDAGNLLILGTDGKIKATLPATTVSNTVAGIGLARTLTTTVNGVTGAPVFIPDQNNSILTIGGTAAAPTISNDGGVASVALPAVPPTSNTFVVTKAGGAVSTVQGVSGTQAIPAGTIVETLGYNAAGAPVYQAIATAAPQTADNGLTKTANNTQLGGTLLGATTIATSPANTLAITGLVANTTPTDFVTRDAAGRLTQSSLASVAPNVTFGTVAPVVAPTTKKGDEYYITSTGTSAGAIQSRWIYDGTIWVNTATTVPDDIVDVSGATLPIVFPVATLPGTPVFVPATPTSTTAIFAIANGTGIQYAKWSGTQYISGPAPLTPNVRYGIPAPTVIAGTDKKNDTYIQTADGTSAGATIAEWVYDGTIWKNVTVSGGGHFRSGTGLTAPDGVADPTENVSRIGKTGFGITDPSTLKFTYELDGTTGIRQDVLANSGAVCTILAASTSVKSSIVVTQTVVDAVLLFAAPNIAAMAGQVFTVINSDLSTNKMSYLGYDIHPNQSLTFVHTGRMWQIEEVGINSDVQIETAATVLPTSLTALNSFTVVPGGIQSSTTAWVEVPGTSFVATSGGEYLVKYVAYASCSGGLSTPNVANGFRIAVGSNIATGTVQVTFPATGRIIPTSESLITNVAAGQIDPYTKTVIVKAKPGETVQLQMNSQVGAQIVYQSPTQNSRLEYSRIVSTAPAAFYSTPNYSAPTANTLTYLGTGLPQPAAGVALQIPANFTSWLVTDGNYTPFVALPIANTVSGRFSVYVFNSAGFNTTISSVGTDLPANAVIPSGQARSMHFEWSDGKWRWVPSPEPTSAGVRLQRRGTFAAPLTGAIAVAIDDSVLVVGNGSVTTLPSPAAPNTDRPLRIKKPGVGTAQLVGSIDGVANLTLSGVSESLDLQSDGNTWMRV